MNAATPDGSRVRVGTTWAIIGRPTEGRCELELDPARAGYWYAYVFASLDRDAEETHAYEGTWDAVLDQLAAGQHITRMARAYMARVTRQLVCKATNE